MSSDWLTDEKIESMSSGELEDYIRDRLSDQWWRLNNLYYITDKSGKRVIFRMNEAQRLLFENMWFFNIILKARQLGFSTAIQIFILDSALFNEDMNCGVVAQDLAKAREIFRTKIMYPYDHLPDWLRCEIPTITKNTTEVTFANKSKITVSTGFRSGTVQILHVSEFAKICATQEGKADEVIDGTLNAVHPGNIAFIESTAEGAAGHYYEMCLDSMSRQDANLELTDIDFKFFFFPWWDEPTYTMNPPATGLKLTKAQDEYFSALESFLGKHIPEDRKMWYITKERQQKGKMKQEFPSTPQEAFLTSGRKVFNDVSLMLANSKVERPILVYDINPETGVRKVANKRIDMGVFGRNDAKKASEAALGFMLVWEMPEDGEQYVIGADVSEGLEHGDKSSFDVVNKRTGKQVGHWFGLLPTKRYAKLIKHVGEWYNYAFVGVERNNHGHAVLDELRDTYPLKYLYTEEHLDRETDNEETKRIGWYTSHASKEMLISDMEDELDNEESGIRWVGTINEFYTFVRDEKGKAGGMAGSHDDQTMSYMITRMMRAKAPIFKKPSKRESSSNKHWMER